MWRNYHYPQVQSVYLWEDQTLFSWYQNRPRLTLHQCKDLVEKICNEFKIIIPLVKDGRGCRYASATYHQIQLPRYYRTEIVVLHECAHVIQEHIRGSSDHEEEFVGIYVCLLEMFMKCSRVELGCYLKQYNVRYQKLLFQDIQNLLRDRKHFQNIQVE